VARVHPGKKAVDSELLLRANKRFEHYFTARSSSARCKVNFPAEFPRISNFC
jgi:hypothetical protein